MSIEKAKLLIANSDFAGARKFLRSLLLRNKINMNAMYLLSIAEAELGNVDEALSMLSKIIAIDPHHAEAHYTKANLLVILNKHLDALPHHDRATELLTSNPWSFINRGISRAALKNFTGALNDFDRSIELDPTLSVAFGNKGNALLEMNQLEQSLQFLDKAIELNPFNIGAFSGKSACLFKLKQSAEALTFADRAIKLKPDYAEAWSNRGNALNDLKRHEEALASYYTAIELKPDYAEAWCNRGVALDELSRHKEALASYERSIELKPDFAEAWSNRGNALNDLQHHDEALASYERAIKLKPDADYVLGSLLQAQMKICDWTDLDGRCQALRSRLLAGDIASDPFCVLGLFDDPHLQRQCAELYAKNKLSFEMEIEPITKMGRRDPKNKVRIGYFSADFHNHATMYLMARLFECHDRKKFEIFGFSFGPDRDDAMRSRAQNGLDSFFEVSSLSDADIASLARQHQIDIAVDLKGYTQNSRTAIFAHRAAPIQINYLGFPGTMGTPMMDYLISDPLLISEDSQNAYLERIIYLPNSYQVNDFKRSISDRVFTREELGLPESSFIFCCFNNNWKILPEIFDAWVRIIRSVPNSVLWLYEDNPTAARNLQAQAMLQNLDPNRLVFARHMPHEEHLGRYRLADLFLDTFPYGAHTTGSDALWAGLPVLTRSGKSFASRVASSLLHAVGLRELVTHTTEEYESLAIELAESPEKITSLKARLAENRSIYPLFSTTLFTQHIESAYLAAYDRHHNGLAPEHIYVSP